MTSVAVVIPVRNAGPDFGANLVRFADYFAPYRNSYSLSYVIVDDASTDDTLTVSESFARYRQNATVVPHRHRRCDLGQALRRVFHRVSAEYTIVIDGAAAYAPAAAMDLLETLERTGADVAVTMPEIGRIPLHRLTSKLRVYRSDFLKRLSFRFWGAIGIWELIFAAIRARGRIVERPTARDWLTGMT
jgi:glycosyltransferase involved in cell wall biosynthesis